MFWPQMVAEIGNMQVTVGTEEPMALPGYWVGPPPDNLIRRTKQDKGYCDWDPNECNGEEGCSWHTCSWIQRSLL